MVGGHIIENAFINLPILGDARKIWVVDGEDECIVYAETAASCLLPGERIWWQCGEIYARNDAFSFKKIGYSRSPQAMDMGN